MGILNISQQINLPNPQAESNNLSLYNRNAQEKPISCHKAKTIQVIKMSGKSDIIDVKDHTKKIMNVIPKPSNKTSKIFLMIIIFALGIFFRFNGLNWDSSHHLHPDERFLNMLINDMGFPNSWSEYFSPKLSPINPRNYSRDFFVYGNWPITLSKFINVTTGSLGLEEIALVGRKLSAIADSLVIIVVFLTASSFQKNLKLSKNHFLSIKAPYWAALAYALFVLSIQQSHFFTTDTFLNLFCATSLYFAIKYLEKNQKNIYQIAWLFISGIFLGWGIGSKITAFLFLPLILTIIFIKNLKLESISWLKSFIKIFIHSLLFLLISYFSLRFVSPYMFSSADFFDVRIEPKLIDNLKQLKTFEGDDVWYPPAIQWINRPFTFGITNLAVFGIGLGSFFFLILGMIRTTKYLKKYYQDTIVKITGKSKNLKSADKFFFFIFFLIAWLISIIVYYSSQFVASSRYFLPLYPYFAILIGFGIDWLLDNKCWRKIKIVIILSSLLVWPLLFNNIYQNTHSRVQASQWIYQNISPESKILCEHWDDALPLNLPQYPYRYQPTQLPVFWMDNDQKWEEVDAQLNQAEYYILSSNRAWGSIQRVPEKYPQMSEFYRRLFAEETEYKLVAKFDSFPSLEYLGFPIMFNDSWAEEAFTVYDHPEVYIFKKQ